MNERSKLITQLADFVNIIRSSKGRLQGGELRRIERLLGNLSAEEKDFLQKEIERLKPPEEAQIPETTEDREGSVPDTEQVPITPLSPNPRLLQYLKECNPLKDLARLTNEVASWDSDVPDESKAYVLSCFSELAYFSLGDNEVGDRNRYKIFPSSLLEVLIEYNLRIDVSSLFEGADLPVTVTRTENFLYMVFKTPSVCIISVRGTEFSSLQDWRINLYAKRDRSSGDRFHQGFYNEARKAEKLLLKVVGDRKPIYFTGHSLGGAVAGILSQIWERQSNVMTPYIFASPRFASIATMRKRPPYGYAAPYDLVPHLPLKMMGFADAGLPLKIVGAGRRHFGIRVLVRWLTPLRGGAAPHAIERYRTELRSSNHVPHRDTEYVEVVMRWIKEEMSVRPKAAHQ